MCYYDHALHTQNTNMDTITPDSGTGYWIQISTESYPTSQSKYTTPERQHVWESGVGFI